MRFEHTVCIRNEPWKQMTQPWQIILNAVQANGTSTRCCLHHGAAKMTIRADADTEKGKNYDGDITPAGFVSTSPSWKNHSDPLALLSSPLNMFG